MSQRQHYDGIQKIRQLLNDCVRAARRNPEIEALRTDLDDLNTELKRGKFAQGIKRFIAVEAVMRRSPQEKQREALDVTILAPRWNCEREERDLPERVSEFRSEIDTFPLWTEESKWLKVALKTDLKELEVCAGKKELVRASVFLALRVIEELLYLLRLRLKEEAERIEESLHINATFLEEYPWLQRIHKTAQDWQPVLDQRNAVVHVREDSLPVSTASRWIECMLQVGGAVWEEIQTEDALNRIRALSERYMEALRNEEKEESQRLRLADIQRTIENKRSGLARSLPVFEKADGNTTVQLCPDQEGAYLTFGNGTASIHWHASTGPHMTAGAIRTEWARLDWEQGALGYPITDEEELNVEDFTVLLQKHDKRNRLQKVRAGGHKLLFWVKRSHGGKYNRFQRGTIYSFKGEWREQMKRDVLVVINNH